MAKPKIPLISIVGPTATGKTELAINLALKFGGEIVSGDSMQIYKEFDILSAKPSSLQLKKVPHHLINALSVKEEFSVAKFTNLASKSIYQIFSRGNVPLLVGGTGLYIDSLLKNINFEENKDDEKAKIDLSNLSNEDLLSELKKIDPVSAEKIHINDTKRLKRAIEFFYASGYPISEQSAESKFTESRYKTCKIGLNYKNRELLYEKINKRVDDMFASGLVEEVSRVLKMDPGKTANAAIGYKEIVPYILGKCSKQEAMDCLKQATRRYAKRQLTWFRRDKEINWIYIDEFDDFEGVIKRGAEIISTSDLFKTNLEG